MMYKIFFFCVLNVYLNATFTSVVRSCFCVTSSRILFYPFTVLNSILFYKCFYFRFIFIEVLFICPKKFLVLFQATKYHHVLFSAQLNEHLITYTNYFSNENSQFVTF